MKGILFADIGTPAQPTLKSVALFLGRFLSDKQVISLPWGLRHLVVWGCIVPFRTFIVWKRYKMISNPHSPLYTNIQRLTTTVQQMLKGTHLVTFGFRHSCPSISNAITFLSQNGCRQIEIHILSPLYSESINGSIIEYCKAFPQVTIRHTLEPVVKAWAEKVKDASFVVMSFHSLPQSEAAIAYYNSAAQLAEEIATVAKLPKDRYMISFQSRFSYGKWLGPSTEEIQDILIAKGIPCVTVITPGFVLDNIETLWELDIFYKNRFLSRGGKEWNVVPCLQDSRTFYETFVSNYSSNHLSC